MAVMVLSFSVALGTVPWLSDHAVQDVVVYWRWHKKFSFKDFTASPTSIRPFIRSSAAA
jgi:hypothetical protein